MSIADDFIPLATVRIPDRQDYLRLGQRFAELGIFRADPKDQVYELSVRRQLVVLETEKDKFEYVATSSR